MLTSHTEQDINSIQTSAIMKKSPSLFRKFDPGKLPDEMKVKRTASKDSNRLSVPESPLPPSEESNASRRSSISLNEIDPKQMIRWKDPESYHWKHTHEDFKDVGQLKLRVIGCKGLHGADFNGKSDPYALVQVGDINFKTNTIKKTLNPQWNEEFIFPIKEISDLLTFAVFDKDRFNDPEFLGKLAIPMWRIVKFERKIEHTFALKDSRYEKRAKGTHPQVILMFEMIWNPIRLSIRTIKRQEEAKPIPFKRSLFINNVQRVRKVIHFIGNVNGYMQSCFSWENKSRSIKAFIIFELFVYYFNPTFLPLFLLLVIFAYPVYSTDLFHDWFDPYTDMEHSEDSEDEDKSDKKTLSEKYKAVQEVTAFVQNTLGKLSSTAERIKNIVSFAVPFLSYLAVGFLVFATILLYLVPVRTLVMIYGVNKFSKRLIRPDHIPSSEFFNFLARVPDDPTLQKVEELSMFDEELLKQEEEERRKKESRIQTKFSKRVSSFLYKDSKKSSRENPAILEPEDHQDNNE